MEKSLMISVSTGRSASFICRGMKVVSGINENALHIDTDFELIFFISRRAISVFFIFWLPC
jgi:hypothetical protein